MPDERKTDKVQPAQLRTEVSIVTKFSGLHYGSDQWIYGIRVQYLMSGAAWLFYNVVHADLNLALRQRV